MNEELEKLKQEIQSCNKCSIRGNTNIPCWDELGNVNSRIMFCGEAPGRTESQNGIPFSGKCGQYLTRCLLSIGLDRSKVFISNTCMCRPVIEGKDKDRAPTTEEVSSCISYLFKQVELIQPRIIVTLGRVSTCTLLNRNVSLAEVRAELQDYFNNSSIKIFPVFHPSFLMQYGSSDILQQNWNDWQKLKLIIKDFK